MGRPLLSNRLYREVTQKDLREVRKHARFGWVLVVVLLKRKEKSKEKKERNRTKKVKRKEEKEKRVRQGKR